MTINDLQDGFKGDITVLITEVSKGVTAKGAPYLSFSLQDKSGNMVAKYWNVKEEDLDKFKPGMLVKVQGDVLCHKKQLQFRVTEMQEADIEMGSIYDYAKSSKYSEEELRQRMLNRIQEIKNPNIATLIRNVMSRFDKAFYEYPAATKNHHDYVGGLATHILGMLDLASCVCTLYPSLNLDLLYGGIIMHDLGKMIELNEPIVSEYTKEGRLLGHISIMQAILYETANLLDIDGEEVLLLRHMILSHHGEYEYGSPVLPMIPEAEILHMIDNMDARMSTMEKALQNIAPGEFTTRIFAMENRSLYKSKLK